MIATDLFGSGAGEGQMTLTATQGAMSEVSILSPDAPSHGYFYGGFATFIDFLRVGVAHILTGPDHLLFLLTVIVAAAGWRYWLSVLTSFTIAHSITLTLAALNVVHVSPAIVEPGIAASIVLMAALNLFGDRLAATAGQGRRVAVVFACGLLHGLGFASAIGAMAVDVTHRLATLAGFNLGIELGQFLFLGTVLALASLVRLLPRLGLPAIGKTLRLAHVASITAAVLGSAMLVERVLPVLPHVS
jgi:hydrogenase/urease accessory protein HupE